MNAFGKSRLRISFFLLGSALAALVVCFASAAVIEVWQARQQTPRLAADGLVKALRTHHRQTGRFPADFRELEARVWKHKEPPDFGADRKVNLDGERLRFPAGLTAATREWLIETKLPEIDRRIENGASLYDKRGSDGAVLEKGVLSDIDRLSNFALTKKMRRSAGVNCAPCSKPATSVIREKAVRQQPLITFTSSTNTQPAA